LNSRITVALPAYNEEETIAKVLAECQAVLDGLPNEYELIVVDNCSTDRTAATVESLAAGDGRIRLISHAENRLYSGSCETALRSATGEYLIIMDSDGQMVPSDIPLFLARIDGGEDVVFGRRKERHDPVFRLMSSKLFNFLGKAFLRYPFADLNCGIRAFNRRAIDAVHLSHRINMANPEIYVKARINGLGIAEMNVQHRERLGGTTSHDFGKSWQLLREVLRYFNALRRELASVKRVG